MQRKAAALRQGRRPALRLHLGLDQVHARLGPGRVAVLPGGDARGRRGRRATSPAGWSSWPPRTSATRTRRRCRWRSRPRTPSSTSGCRRRTSRSRRPRSTWRWRRSPTPPGGALGAARGAHPRARRRSSRRPRCAPPPTRRAKALGRGIGYDYPHDHPGDVNDQEHLPDGPRAPALLRPGRRASPSCASRLRATRSGESRGAAAIDLELAAAAARTAQPLWSLLPVAARARYIRRAAVAMLDELDELALRLADETGWPRTPHRAASELLPAVRGLRALADDGPRALADRRLTPARRAARRALDAARAVAGGRDRAARAVRLAVGGARAGGRGRAAGRQRRDPRRAARRSPPSACARSSCAPASRASCSRHAPGTRPRRRVPARHRPAAARRGAGRCSCSTGAPRERVVEAALWAAFAGSGRHPAAAGRLVMVEAPCPGWSRRCARGAARLKVGDPRDRRTPHIGTERARRRSPAPAIGSTVGADDPRFTDPPTGRCSRSSWRRTPRRRSARRARRPRRPDLGLGARPPARASGSRGGCRRRRPGSAATGSRRRRSQVRIARHVVPRQLEWRAAWAPGTPRLPVDGTSSRRSALAEVRHGRESRRWPALRAGAASYGRAKR